MPILTLVSNRLPISVKKVGGKLEYQPSVGGLATGLSSYTTDKESRWIGWPGIASDELTAKEKREITLELKKHHCYPVFLTKKQVDEFYNGYSNSILWPLFHDIDISTKATEAQTRYFAAYRDVNAVFAKTVLELSEPGRLVWVHDYQLLLLPALLRAERPNDKIGFFLHIPFPHVTHFTKLPEAQELLSGMLGADLLGFHTKSYVHNFFDAASQFDMGVVTESEVVVGSRAAKVADFPMGIDYAKYSGALKSLEVRRQLVKLRAKYRRRKLILTVDRLEPAKGLVERAEAFRQLLRQKPKLRGKVILVMLVVPSRTDIDEYQQLKIKLEQLVNEVNYEFGTFGWKPIDYTYASLPFEHVCALYRAADVAFIAPLRDGMNLVAKEYLASQTRRHGVLILSHTAGAAHELKHAVIVDPSKQESLVRGLSRAIDISKTSWQERIKKLRKHVQTATVQGWAGDFMDTLHASTPAIPRVTRSLNEAHMQKIVDSFHSAKHRLLLMDYDGSITPIVDRPEDAVPSRELKSLLRKLAEQPHTDVVIISGRTRADLTKWFSTLPVGLAAEHGAFYRLAGTEKWHRSSDITQGWRDKVVPILEKYSVKTKGSFVETKETAVVWHYRLANSVQAQANLLAMRTLLAPIAERYNLRVYAGKKILEIRTAGANKGKAARRWMDYHEPNFILATGDDYTDEDIFRTLPSNAYTIKIGFGRTTASLRAKKVDDVLYLLKLLAKNS